MINNKDKINDINYAIQNNYNHIHLFHCNQMHPNFTLDEKIPKDIIHIYISPTDYNNKIRFISYYKKFNTLILSLMIILSFPWIIKKSMLFINLNVHGENASPTIKKKHKLHWSYHNKIIKEADATPFRF